MDDFTIMDCLVYYTMGYEFDISNGHIAAMQKSSLGIDSTITSR